MTVKKPLVKKLFAGGSLLTMLSGLVMEMYTQMGDLRAEINLNKKDIAVIQKAEQFQEKQNTMIYKKLDSIEQDIKTLLRRK